MSINLTLARLDVGLAEKLKVNPAIAIEIEIDPARDERLKSFGYSIERTLTEGEGPEERLDLGQDWHLLDHLFTTSKPIVEPRWARAFLTKGGQPIGQGAGYGPARLLTPQETADVDTFLSEFDLAKALQDLTPGAIKKAGIYSFSASNLPIEEIHRIVNVTVRELRGFMRRCSTTGSVAYIFMA